MNETSGKLNVVIGSLAVIQDMFKEFLGLSRRSSRMPAPGHRGEAEEPGVEGAGGDARRDGPASPHSGPRP